MEKNILICGESLNDGGVETVIINDAIALKKKGCKPYILAEHGIYTEKIKKYGIKNIDFKFEFMNGFDMQRAQEVIDIIKKYEISEVHIHKFINIPSCLPACILSQVPYVVHLHEGLPISYDWVLNSYNMYSDMLKIYFENAYKIIAITENVKKYNMDLFNIPESKYIVVYNSLDFDLFKTEKICSLPIKNFLIISRLSKEKEVSILNGINLFKEYNKKIKGCKLRIAGSGNAEDDIKRFVEQKNIKNIEFIGRTEKIKEEIEQSEIVLGMGRCILEAVAAKRLCCIIGYEKLKPIVKGDIIQKAQAENFSGRGLKDCTEKEIINELLDLEENEIKEIINKNYVFAKENFDINKNVYSIKENINLDYKEILPDLFNMLNKSMIDNQNHINEKNEIWEAKVWLESQYNIWMKEAENLKKQLNACTQKHKRKRFIK